MEKVCVLGTGSWGSALGLTLAKKGYEVSMWTLNEEQAKRINKTRENIDYLPGVLFPNNMTVTISLEEAVLNSIIIVLAVPSQAIRSVCNQIKPFIKDEQIIVDVAKGLEKGTGLRLSEVVEEELPNNISTSPLTVFTILVSAFAVSSFVLVPEQPVTIPKVAIVKLNATNAFNFFIYILLVIFQFLYY